MHMGYEISFAAAVFMFVGLNFMYCTKYSWIAEVPANPDLKKGLRMDLSILCTKRRESKKKKSCIV